jgi:lysophospholipase L1-like esterase
MLSTFQFTRDMRLLQEGDSVTGMDVASLGYMALLPLQLAAFGAFANPVPARTGKSVPQWRNAATNGATSAIIAARIAAEVTAVNPTHFILACGINDATSAVARATTLANHTAILAALPSTCQILVFDPFAAGEKWPTGQNTSPSVDAAIDFISTDLQALLLSTYNGRAMFVSWRHGIYDVQEPLLNLPGPGITIGPLTQPDTAGTHLNARGTGFVTRQAAPLVSFAA